MGILLDHFLSKALGTGILLHHFLSKALGMGILLHHFLSKTLSMRIQPHHFLSKTLGVLVLCDDFPGQFVSSTFQRVDLLNQAPARCIFLLQCSNEATNGVAYIVQLPVTLNKLALKEAAGFLENHARAQRNTVQNGKPVSGSRRLVQQLSRFCQTKGQWRLRITADIQPCAADKTLHLGYRANQIGSCRGLITTSDGKLRQPVQCIDDLVAQQWL